MNKFLIANMLRRGAPVWTPSGIGQSIADSIDLRRELSEVDAYFDASIASELYWHGRQNYYSLEDDFGPLMPPFPKIWMEWKVPDRVYIEGRWGDGNGTVWAALVSSSRSAREKDKEYSEQYVRAWFDNLRSLGKLKAEPTDAEYAMLTRQFNAGELDRLIADTVGVQVDLFFTSQSGNVVSPNQQSGEGVYRIPVGKVIALDPKTGRYITNSVVDLAPKGVDHDHVERLLMMADNNVVWMALQLINCRNVTTREVGSVFARSGLEKRRGKPVIKYHTIVLPGSSAGVKQRAAKKGDALALHKVRGHFKTFTADRPLLGRHVGTYWWGWQVRGNPERGVVISDYQLGA